MNKKEAEKAVQKKLAEAKELLAQAAALMDEHSFSVRFFDLEYVPNYDYDPELAAEGGDPFGFYFEDGISGYDDVAGAWMPSMTQGC